MHGTREDPADDQDEDAEADCEGSMSVPKSGCVADFVAEYLGGEWEGLREVNPLLFYNSKMPLAYCEWLKCPGRSFDCDDTDLARAVYREVWKLESPEFRGDTMNSFRTIFGRERFTHDVCDVPRVYAGSAADRRFGIPSDLLKRIQVFWEDYHTIISSSGPSIS